MSSVKPVERRVRQDLEEAVRGEIMPLIERLGLGEYWRRFHQLLDLESATVETLREQQRCRLRSFIATAARNVPFYREVFAELDLDPEAIDSLEALRQLPTLDKQTLLRHFPDRLTSETSDRDSWRYRSTSGTAYRIMSVTDFDARQWRYALHLRSLAIAANYAVGQPQVLIRTQACTEVCAAAVGEEFSAVGMSTLPVEREWPPHGLARLTMQETLLEPLEGRGEIPAARLDAYLDEIDRVAPTLLRGLPQYLLLLARHLERSGRDRPSVGRILVQDSLPTIEMKQEIARAFGCEVRETYGSSELGSLAAECEAGFLHLASSLFVVEVLTPDGQPVSEGDIGIFAVTAMANQAMPLIRYRLGDLGRTIAGDCACGRATPRLEVVGRVREALFRNGRWINARQVATALASVPDLDHVQLVERGEDHLEVLVVPRPEAAVDAGAAEKAVRSLVGASVAVRVRKVRRIAPESSGKFALVKTLARDFDPRDP